MLSIDRSRCWKQVLLVVLALIWAASVPTNAFSNSPLCEPSVEASLLAFPPVILFGMSVNFESGVLKSFPSGSCEDDLAAWLDKMGFEPPVRSPFDATFISEPDEMARNYKRRRDGGLVNRRDLSLWAPIGRSYFSVAWNSDEAGRLIEVYADSKQLHFELP
nr:hypothetical protein [Marinicella sp. W31]MDC2880183.1 hypothetical protein [Marinicella sp. W31]